MNLTYNLISLGILRTIVGLIVMANTTASGVNHGVYYPDACGDAKPPYWCPVGSTDPCAWIGAAISQLPPTGGSVDATGIIGAQTCKSSIVIAKPVLLRFGNATYILSSPIVFNASGIDVRGAGSHTSAAFGGTTFKAANTFKGDALIDVGLPIRSGNGNVVDGPVLSNVNITGNGASGPNCISISGNPDAIHGVIDHVDATSCNYGLYVDPTRGTFDWTVRDSRFVSDNTGAFLQFANAWDLVANEFSNNHLDGVRLDGVTSIKMYGRDIEANGTCGIHISAVNGTSKALKFLGGYFEPPNGATSSYRDFCFDAANHGNHYVLGVGIDAVYSQGILGTTPYSIEIPSNIFVEALKIQNSSFSSFGASVIHNGGGCSGCNTDNDYTDSGPMVDVGSGFDEIEPQSDGIIFRHAVVFDSSADFRNPLSLSSVRVPSGSTFFIDFVSPSYGVDLTQVNAATSSVNYDSPRIVLHGSFWNGSASAQDEFALANTIGSGMNPGAELTIGHSGTKGLASVVLNSGIGFQPGTSSVESLPIPSRSRGRVYLVTDSTTVSKEGQTCAGGSNSYALAFSDGSSWKCF